VSDTIMPGGMGGRELALRARALRPGMPVLLITGYAANAELEDVTASDIPVLRKPFQRDALEAALRGLESHEDMTL
jgi:CheY-like chemotaxis protein